MEFQHVQNENARKKLEDVNGLTEERVDKVVEWQEQPLFLWVFHFFILAFLKKILNYETYKTYDNC
jgi:hypothetical protein